jgi:hypothetical protein
LSVNLLQAVLVKRSQHPAKAQQPHFDPLPPLLDSPFLRYGHFPLSSR